MRNFNVTVNGKTYSVEIEETAAQPAAQQPVAVATPAPAAQPVQAQAPQAPQPVQQPAPQAAPKAAKASEGVIMTSPLPGLILAITVNDGKKVKKGEKIMVLEAMKMEHDIFASNEGVITTLVKKGDKVETGAQLAVIQ